MDSATKVAWITLGGVLVGHLVSIIIKLLDYRWTQNRESRAVSDRKDIKEAVRANTALTEEVKQVNTEALEAANQTNRKIAEVNMQNAALFENLLSRFNQQGAGRRRTGLEGSNESAESKKDAT
jgi:hypothetical protein